MLLADYYFKCFYHINSGPKDKTKIKKAISIYEKNHSKLSNKQLNLLSNVYLKGHCVDINLEKAKLYDRANNEEITKCERIASFNYLDDLVIVDDYFKNMLNEFKKDVISNNNRIIEFINLITYGYVVKRNDEIIDKLVNVLVANNHPYGYFCLYVKTLENQYYEMLQKEESAYKYYALYFKHINENSNNSLIQEALLKSIEMGNLLAKKEYAINLYKGKYFEKDIDKSKPHTRLFNVSKAFFRKICKNHLI